MQQQEGGGNLVNQSQAKDAPNVCDSQSAAGRVMLHVGLILIFFTKFSFPFHHMQIMLEMAPNESGLASAQEYRQPADLHSNLQKEKLVL